LYGITNVQKEFFLSTNGYFNKANDYIYALIAYEDQNDLNNIKDKTLFVKLLYDGTSYQYNLIDSMYLSVNCKNFEIKDALYYKDDKFYIEFRKAVARGNIVPFSIYIDLVDKNIKYQGNLRYYFNSALSFYPVYSSYHNC
jgi:hypothetical protein